MESVGHGWRDGPSVIASLRWIAAIAIAAILATTIGGCVAAGPGTGRPPGDVTRPVGGAEESTPTGDPRDGGAPDTPRTQDDRDPSRAVAAVAGPDVAPPGLDGVTWTAPGTSRRFVVGVVGSRGRLILPAGEAPLAVADASVASVEVGRQAAGSVVHVRSVRDGGPVIEIERPGEIDSAAFAGDRLLLSGHDSTAPGQDPGVVSVSLADGSTATLIPPSSGPDPDAPYARSVRVSPSGATAASGLCTSEGCSLDAIDLRSGAVRQVAPASSDFPGVLTDRVVLVGDPDSSSLAGLDLATGRRLWQRTGAEFQYAYATTDGRIVLSYIDHAGPYEFVVAVVDPLTGAERVVLRRDVAAGLTLWPELSTDDIAVLGTGGRFEDVAARGGYIHAGALDLASGGFEPDAVRIEIAP